MFDLSQGRIDPSGVGGHLQEEQVWGGVGNSSKWPGLCFGYAV